MAWYDILIGAALLISAIVIIGIILLQEGRRQGIAGAISGGADTFLSKSKAHSLSKIAPFDQIRCFDLHSVGDCRKRSLHSSVRFHTNQSRDTLVSRDLFLYIKSAA